MDKKIPLIIDCDPGGDDAFAIMMMQGSGKFDIRAICPVNGNSPLKATKENAMNTACYLGINTRIAIGADKPLIQGISVGDNLADLKAQAEKNGENAEEIGNKFIDMDFGTPNQEFNPDPAWDVIYQEAKKFPGELVILAVGPLTNLAIALTKYQDLKGLIKQIVCMGGTTGPGNANSYAEFNTFIDPYAWQCVLKSGVPFVMMGLNVTDQGYHTLEELKELAQVQSKISPMIDAFYRQAVEWDQKLSSGDFPMEMFGENPWSGGKMSYPDAVAAAYLIDPTCIHAEYKQVKVETRSPIAFGQTMVDLRKGTRGAVPNCTVGLTCDREKYLQIVKDCVAAYK